MHGRFGLDVQPEPKSLNIVLSSSVTLWAESFFTDCTTPNVQSCAFIVAVAIYVLLGRLATFLGSGKHLLVVPSRITIHLWSQTCDIPRAGIQCYGKRHCYIFLDNRRDHSYGDMHNDGLIIQLISFLIFTVIFLYFKQKAWTFHHSNGWYSD